MINLHKSKSFSGTFRLTIYHNIDPVDRLLSVLAQFKSKTYLHFKVSKYLPNKNELYI